MLTTYCVPSLTTASGGFPDEIAGQPAWYLNGANRDEAVAYIYQDTSGNTHTSLYTLGGVAIIPMPATWGLGDANSDAMLTQLQAINGNTDTVEALQASTNAALVVVQGYVDQVEALMTALGNNTDGIESALTALGFNTDGLETLLAATNTLLTTGNTQTDTLEALASTGNASLATLVTNTASPYPATLTPGAASYAGIVAAFQPAALSYFSITLLTTVVGGEFSTDAGGTWIPSVVGTITWGNNSEAPVNSTGLRFRSTLAGAAFKLIWEA